MLLDIYRAIHITCLQAIISHINLRVDKTYVCTYYFHMGETQRNICAMILNQYGQKRSLNIHILGDDFTPTIIVI